MLNFYIFWNACFLGGRISVYELVGEDKVLFSFNNKYALSSIHIPTKSSPLISVTYKVKLIYNVYNIYNTFSFILIFLYIEHMCVISNCSRSDFLNFLFILSFSFLLGGETIFCNNLIITIMGKRFEIWFLF